MRTGNFYYVYALARSLLAEMMYHKLAANTLLIGYVHETIRLYKISSTRNRNVTLALKCIVNLKFRALLHEILRFRFSVRKKNYVEDISDFYTIKKFVILKQIALDPFCGNKINRWANKKVIALPTH